MKRILSAIASLSVLATVLVSAIPAQADVIPYRCVKYTVADDGEIVRYTSICHRYVEPVQTYVEPVSAIAPATPTGDRAYIDGNANLRTGASTTSRVILNTTQSSVITIHSWQGDWAWITMVTGDEGWTHRNNVSFR